MTNGEMLAITLVSLAALIIWIIGDTRPSKLDNKEYWNSKENKWKGKH
jgi:hypothetical protein